MAILGTIAVLAVADALGDADDGVSRVHIAVELLIAAFACAGVVAAGFRARALGREAAQLRLERDALSTSFGALRAQLAQSRAEIAHWHAESERWRSEARTHLEGLATAIDAQFARWQLSDAEREVALLLLKGLSHREIATVRNVGEVTVRQQARSLYRKAGLEGRADLAAFFLEDLLAGDPKRLRGGSAHAEAALGSAEEAP